MHCHLLIPGLTPYLPPGAGDPARGLCLSALETLLARGREVSCANGGWMDWLCREFGLEKQRDWPTAALTLLAEGGSPADGFWLLADPVHLQLQRDRMVLMDAGGLAITGDEAAGLSATLNRHFADAGLIFTPTHPGRWHVRLSTPAQIETCPLDAVIGKNIREFLPGGPDGKFWHRTLNEIQMLLHDHPVNVARELRGELPVNSLWLWGGGVLPAKATSPYTKIWAEDALAIGLAMLSGTSRAKPAETATEWLQHADPGSHLILFDSLHHAALHGDVLRWRENLLKLEADWFAPLRHALSRGRLARLSLTIFGGDQARTFTVSRADLLKFWRRKKPLMNFSGALST